jgi:hydrogenase nickel incorporation protein HypA/HybF
MHELSLAGGIVKLVEDAAVRDHFKRVSQLRLEAGALSGVEVRALRFALDAVAPGTCLEGAAIEIEEPPGQAWCLRRHRRDRLAHRSLPSVRRPPDPTHRRHRVARARAAGPRRLKENEPCASSAAAPTRPSRIPSTPTWRWMRAPAT